MDNTYSFRGQGFFTYKDTSNPRTSDDDVARNVSNHFNTKVVHICKNAYVGHHLHVLQDMSAYLFEKSKRKTT